MVCLHCPRLRPIPRQIKKIGLCGIVWTYSHCTETDDNTDSHSVLCTYFRYLPWSRSLVVLSIIRIPPIDYIICFRPVVKSDKNFVLPITEAQRQGVIAGVGSVESSYLIQATSCPVDHMHPDLAAIMVFIQYLTQLEGPMWRQIRGLGLSYHYRFVQRLLIRTVQSGRAQSYNFFPH